ncbi:MAG: glycosyltransferase [Flavobacteriales bacterium]
MQIDFAITLFLIAYVIVILIVLFFVFQASRDQLFQEKPVSILIPFRNEEPNLKNLVDSIVKLNLSKNSEIILINDNSTDDSFEILENLRNQSNSPIRIVQSPNEGKKSAIEFGVGYSGNDVIITSDADCVFHPEWAVEHSKAYRKNQLTIGLVWIKNTSGVLASLQLLEQIALNAFSIFFNKVKRPIYCSGANLSYDRETFIKLTPYTGNKHIASGDDYFILKAFSDRGYSVKQLLNTKSFVYTEPVKSVKQLMNQKSRWIKKMILNSSYFGYGAIFSILFYITFPILCLVFLSIGLISVKQFVTIVTIKFGIDYLFLFLVALKFKQAFGLIKTFVVQVIYPIYVLGVVLISIFGEVNWKGRPI